jgi:hypothetical protein
MATGERRPREVDQADAAEALRRLLEAVERGEVDAERPQARRC